MWCWQVLGLLLLGELITAPYLLFPVSHIHSIFHIITNNMLFDMRFLQPHSLDMLILCHLLHLSFPCQGLVLSAFQVPYFSVLTSPYSTPVQIPTEHAVKSSVQYSYSIVVFFFCFVLFLLFWWLPSSSQTNTWRLFLTYECPVLDWSVPSQLF